MLDGVQATKPITEFVKILETIQYSGDKETFARQFFEQCERQAMISLINKIPFEKKHEVTAILAAKENLQAQLETLKDYFTEDDRQQALEKATARTFHELLEDFAPTLTAEQKQYLQAHLQIISR